MINGVGMRIYRMIRKVNFVSLNIEIAITSMLLVFIHGIAVASDNEKILHYAKTDNTHGFSRLLTSGYDPNAIYGTKEDQWVMCIAAQNKKIDILKMAIESGGDVNLKNKKSSMWKSTPLNCAALAGNYPAIELLVKNGANANTDNCEKCIGTRTSPYTTTLIYNNYSTLYKLLKLAPIEEKYVDGVKYGLEHFLINPKGEEFQWRAKVAVLLQEMGYEVDAKYRGNCLTDIGCLGD